MTLWNSKSEPNISSPSRESETNPESATKIETNPFFIKPAPGIVRLPTLDWNPPEVVYSLVHNEFRFTRRNQLFLGHKLRNIFRPLAIPIFTLSFSIPYYGDFPGRTVILPFKVWVLRALIGDFRTLWVEHEPFGLDVVRKVERERERREMGERKREREERRRKMLSMISERSWVDEVSPNRGEQGVGVEGGGVEGALGNQGSGVEGGGADGGIEERGDKGSGEHESRRQG